MYGPENDPSHVTGVFTAEVSDFRAEVLGASKRPGRA